MGEGCTVLKLMVPGKFRPETWGARNARPQSGFGPVHAHIGVPQPESVVQVCFVCAKELSLNSAVVWPQTHRSAEVSTYPGLDIEDVECAMLFRSTLSAS
jgi:hypothetical protein